MFTPEINNEINRLEGELSDKQEKYTNGIKSHKDYQTLRDIRDQMHELKLVLAELYSQRDKH